MKDDRFRRPSTAEPAAWRLCSKAITGAVTPGAHIVASADAQRTRGPNTRVTRPPFEPFVGNRT